MELWQITSNHQSQLTAQSKKVGSSSSNSIKSDYAKILAGKIASAREDMEQMSKIQEELEENKKLQEELTGKPQDEDGDQNFSPNQSTETIKRFMPDGSIMFMKIKGGEVVEQFKKKPHFVTVADPSAPQTSSGSNILTMKLKPQLDLFSLLI